MIEQKFPASDAARQLGIKPGTVLRWVQRGKLKGEPKDGMVWVTLEDVRAANEESLKHPARKRWMR